MTRLLTEEEMTRQLADLTEWTRLGTTAITTTLQLSSFAAAVDFVHRVADLAEEMNHHPDIDIRYDKVTLLLSTHAVGGLTQLDIELAHRISDLAR